MTDFLRAVPTAVAARRPSVAIVGVGAIGTVVADALAERAEVVLCRRATAAPMTIEVAGDIRRVDAAVATTPAALGPVDWVVVTVKAQDTATVGPWLDALVGPHTTVVVLQNGIGHAERVADWVGAERVVPGIVYIAAEKVTRDLVVCRDPGALALAAGGDDVSNRTAAAFAGLFDTDRIAVRLVDDFVTESWTKLVMNSALNTVTALTDRTMEVTTDPGVRPLLRALLAEAVLVAEAEGAVFAPGAAETFLLRMDGLPRNSATSMQLDRRAGRPLEHNYLTGAVLAAAERHGVDVPTVRMVHGLIDALGAKPQPVDEELAA
ncbi:ketopantoate reductase family protein [Conyzicola sp.]|uniref:ketopantoate reductase family protein n=1 Tax=Conyzicola sp. TaxID=1969404 RepID=UPI003988EB8F